MKAVIKITTILWIVLTCHSLGLAQSNTNTAGGIAKGKGGEAVISIGQIACQTMNKDDIKITEGVLQPYELSTIQEHKIAYERGVFFKVHPNPTFDFVKLYNNDTNNKNLFYKLYDNDGRLMATGKIINLETIIQMKHLRPSIYILIIIDNQIVIKNIKIIKL